MKFNRAVFGRLGLPPILGVEVVLARLSRKELAVLGYLEPLGV